MAEGACGREPQEKLMIASDALDVDEILGCMRISEARWHAE